MIRKGTRLYSLIKNKCPRCQNASFFKYSYTYNPKKVIKLHDNCSCCGQKYMLEPSFYYGAMYVNYGITVALFVLVFIISKVILQLSILNSFITVLTISFLLTPITLRLSRLIWINMFVNFDKNYKKQKISQTA
ncbi:uncharacterized protein (DUF983 family) [Lutibacter sp. Hel_I_33_5]|uniref:DUF983 domain-containing protein n=1 Tax=Lutibacter sp. Hel_I_33_5 TaxID=1566289 RepID=UPI00119E9D76|nr:DUF983 domain-containing protein [Lutibacter sp. Hel_I_33_5]TVZ56771.1 uncharacterized protein (DUF983 family) [Lutibacter sp. Hel_I_33_5]